jgi:hypothetical protein
VVCRIAQQELPDGATNRRKGSRALVFLSIVNEHTAVLRRSPGLAFHLVGCRKNPPRKGERTLLSMRKRRTLPPGTKIPQYLARDVVSFSGSEERAFHGRCVPIPRPKENHDELIVGMAFDLVEDVFVGAVPTVAAFVEPTQDPPSELRRRHGNAGRGRRVANGLRDQASDWAGGTRTLAGQDVAQFVNMLLEHALQQTSRATGALVFGAKPLYSGCRERLGIAITEDGAEVGDVELGSARAASAGLAIEDEHGTDLRVAFVSNHQDLVARETGGHLDRNPSGDGVYASNRGFDLVGIARSILFHGAHFAPLPEIDPRRLRSSRVEVAKGATPRRR